MRLSAILAACLLMGCQMTDSFDASLWRAQHGSTERDNPRSGLVVALERDHLRAGMARSEVIALLGQPERQTARRDQYALGVSPYGIDYEYYVIDYDDNDRVATFSLKRS